jgi:choline dehydrogenase-like flavoprotein
VGGGSAGSVVASRLSASGEHTVALVEAGGDPSILNNIPELAPYNLHQWATDWRYLIQPQTDACLSLEKRVRYLQAKSVKIRSSKRILEPSFLLPETEMAERKSAWRLKRTQFHDVPAWTSEGLR